MFIFLGESYKLWRNYLQYVVDTINSNQPRYSRATVLSNYFLGERPYSLPQKAEKLYKFKLGEVVRFNLPRESRVWPYKYSLQTGMYTKGTCHQMFKFCFFITPKYLVHDVGVFCCRVIDPKERKMYRLRYSKLS
jgi:hypothetical protein